MIYGERDPHYAYPDRQTARTYSQDELDAAVAAERERCAKLCEDEARIRTEAGNTQAEDSESRGPCSGKAPAAMNCAKGIRGGELL